MPSRLITRRLLTARMLFAVYIFALSPLAAFGQTPNETGSLSPNQTLEREMRGGETHSYQFQLEAGQFAQVEVVQRGIDVAVSLFAPDGKLSVTLDGKGGRLWRETVSCLAEVKGSCRVEISPSQKDAPAGSYTIKLIEPRTATPPDRERLLAERALGEGRQLYDNNQKEKALARYEEAVALWQKIGDKYWEAVTLVNLGWIKNDADENPEAIKAYERAANLLRERQDLIGEGKAISSLGDAYLALEENEKAIAFYERGVSISREAKNRLGEAKALGSLGTSYYYVSENEKARDYYEQALAILRDIKERRGVGYMLNNLGNVYSRLSQQEKARDYYAQALTILRDIKDKRGEAYSLNNLGSIYEELSQNEKAREYYEQGLAVAREIKDKRGESNTLNNLGNVHTHLSQYQKAKDYYEQSLAIAREIKSRYSEGLALSNLGDVFDKLGQYEKAIEYFDKALAIKHEIKDRYGELVVLNKLGVAHSDLGRTEKAREYYEQSLAISRELEDRGGEAYALTNLGIIYKDAGQYEKAREYYEKSLSRLREIKDRTSEGQALMNLGVVYFKLGQNANSLEYYKQALAIGREVKDRKGEADTLHNLMKLREKLGQHQLAIFYGKQAVNVYQEIRANIKELEQESRRSFLKTAENTYRDLTNLLLAANRLAEAQQVLNSFKDQQFFDFDKSQQKQPAPLALTPREAAFVAHYQQTSERVGAIRGQLDDLQRNLGNRQPTPAEAKQIEQLEADLKTASNDFFAAFQKAETEFSRTSNAKEMAGEVDDTTLMQAALSQLSRETKQKAVAIYTLVGEDSFSVLLITPNGIKKATAKIKAEEFNKKVLQFYKALQSPAYDPRPVGKELYDIIFKLIEPEIKRARAQTILWSLDGTLAYVPMAALSPDGKGYLVERYQSVVFTRADKERMTRAVSPNWTGTGFGSSQAQQIDLLGDTLRFPALPGVTKELDAVFRADDSDGIFRGEVFADARFKRETFFAALKQQRPLVHISSHFIFRPGDDTRSFLLLGDGAALTLNEMKRQDRLFEGVELLTLSACDTAAQQPDANGREIDGFAELAQRLGAGAVVASLWSVADKSTADLMTQFYRIYKNAPRASKSKALRQAQLALLNGQYRSKQTGRRRGSVESKSENSASFKLFKKDANAPFAHPYYWSPFILIGNWR